MLHCAQATKLPSASESCFNARTIKGLQRALIQPGRVAKVAKAVLAAKWAWAERRVLPTEDWIWVVYHLSYHMLSSHRWVAELTIWYLPTYAIWTVFRQAPAEPEQKPRNSHIVNASVYETFWDGPFTNIFVYNVPNRFKWYNIHSFCQWGLGAHPSPLEKGSSDSDCATKRGNWWCWREREIDPSCFALVTGLIASDYNCFFLCLFLFSVLGFLSIHLLSVIHAAPQQNPPAPVDTTKTNKSGLTKKLQSAFRPILPSVLVCIQQRIATHYLAGKHIKKHQKTFIITYYIAVLHLCSQTYWYLNSLWRFFHEMIVFDCVSTVQNLVDTLVLVIYSWKFQASNLQPRKSRENAHCDMFSRDTITTHLLGG